jgi:hypothetical protein
VSVLPSARALAWHEAGHAAALCVVGWPPAWVRIDWPSDSLLGSVGPDWESRDPDERTMRELLVSVLQGPISDGERRISDWPILPEQWKAGNRRDAEQAAFIAHYLGIDRAADWGWFVFKAQRLGRTRRFRELVVAIASELERVEVLLRPELVHLTEGANGD